jgi:hypothetical protein
MNESFKISKELEPTGDLQLRFTEEECEKLGLTLGQKFSTEVVDGGILLTPYAEIEIDLDQFDEITLSYLVQRSIEEDKTVEAILEEILTEAVEYFDVENK